MSSDFDQTIVAGPMSQMGPSSTGGGNTPVAAPAVTLVDGALLLPVGSRLGEFEINGVVGQGGFGIVYLAWDHTLDRKVALKEYLPESLASRDSTGTVRLRSERNAETFAAGLRSFINEAKLLAQFDHPSLVKVFRFWEANGTAYMVMPFYEGTTLKEKLSSMGQPPDEIWLTRMLDSLTQALMVMHGAHCYHRDIAPDNVILLKGSETPVLLDFGAARRVITDMTQAITVILKPGYAPIEQYAEMPDMTQGPWTDIYALGAVVHFAITGNRPPPSVGRMLKDPYVSLTQMALPQYSQKLLAATDRALAVRPDERPQSIAELRELLGMGGQTVMGDATMILPRGESMPSRERTAFATMATAGKSGTAGAGSSAAPAKSKTGVIAGGAIALAVLVAGGYWLATSPGKGRTDTPVANGGAPTAPEPTEPVRPAQPFTPSGELDRIVSQATPGFTVQAAAAKSTVLIGKDKFEFAVKSARAGYAYVYMVSSDGSFILLFPNMLDQHNKINANTEVKLPRASWALDAAGPAGTDHFAVVVSASPLDFSETGIKQEGSMFGTFLPALSSALAASGKPDRSPFLGQVKCPDGGACPKDYGAATFKIQETGSSS